MKKCWPDYKVIEPMPDEGSEPLCEGEGPFRQNVGALVVRNHETQLQLLVGQRIDTPGVWQWPQGGAEPGESPEETLRRELWEETGVSRFEILGQLPVRVRYRFPQRLFKPFFPNLGQEQIYFVVRLLSGENPDPTRSGEQEFSELSWLEPEVVVAGAIWFKAGVYRLVHQQLRLFFQQES